jgi:hypothetical protein
MGFGVVDHFAEKLLAERRQRALPQLPGRFTLLDETPLLGGDRAGVHAIGEMVDGAAGDRIAFTDGPFDGRNAAVPRQQRRVIADASELCHGKGFPADAGVAVRGHDQIGTISDLRGDYQLVIGLHDDLDFRGTGRRGKPVFGVGHDDPDDLDAMPPQHIKCRHAEMAGADEGNPHVGYSVMSQEVAEYCSVDNTWEASVTPPAVGAAGYQQDAAEANSTRCQRSFASQARFHHARCAQAIAERLGRLGPLRDLPTARANWRLGVVRATGPGKTLENDDNGLLDLGVIDHEQSLEEAKVPARFGVRRIRKDHGLLVLRSFHG